MSRDFYQGWLRIVTAPAIAFLEAQAKIARDVGNGEDGQLSPLQPSKDRKSAPDDVVDLYPEAPQAKRDAASTLPKSAYPARERRRKGNHNGKD